MIILELEEMTGIGMGQLQFLNNTRLLSHQSIIDLGFYAFLVCGAGVSKEYHTLFVGKGSDGFVQLKIKEVQFGVDPSLSVVSPVADLVIDSLFGFQIQVERAFIGAYFVNGGRGEAGADTAKNS